MLIPFGQQLNAGMGSVGALLNMTGHERDNLRTTGSPARSAPRERALTPFPDPFSRLSITGLFEAFARIDSHGVDAKPVPAEFGVEGFFFRYERHFVYWKRLSNGDVGIVTVLHERMHQIARFRENFFGD